MDVEQDRGALVERGHKRSRSGERMAPKQVARVVNPLGQPGGSGGGEVALVGLMPEEAAQILAQAEGTKPVIAGFESHNGRAYCLVGNTLFSWLQGAADIGAPLEAPADQSIELIDRQGNACVTEACPAVAVLVPGSSGNTLAVVLADGRVLWRPLDRGAQKYEYQLSTLHAGETVTAAAWTFANSKDSVYIFLGTSSGRLHRFGPLGGLGARPAMHVLTRSASGLMGYIPTSLWSRSPAREDGVRRVLPLSVGGGVVASFSNRGFALYHSHTNQPNASLYHEQDLVGHPAFNDRHCSIVDAAVLLSGQVIAVLVAAASATGDVSLELLGINVTEEHIREGGGQAALVSLTRVQCNEADAIDEVSQSRVFTSLGNTSGNYLTYVVNPLASLPSVQLAVYSAMCTPGAVLPDEWAYMQRRDIDTGVPPRDLIAAGPLYLQDALFLLAEPNQALRISGSRSLELAPVPTTGASQDIRQRLRHAFKLASNLQREKALEELAQIAAPNGSTDLAEAATLLLREDIIDASLETGGYWGKAGAMLIAQTLQRKANQANQFLRFLSEYGVLSRLTISQKMCLIEEVEKVAATQRFCEDVTDSRNDEEVKKFIEAAQQQGDWAADTGEANYMAQLNLPPLDRFLANPSNIMAKIQWLQRFRETYLLAMDVDRATANVAVVLEFARTALGMLRAALAERERLNVEYGSAIHSQSACWLSSERSIHVLASELSALKSLLQHHLLERAHITFDNNKHNNGRAFDGYEIGGDLAFGLAQLCLDMISNRSDRHDHKWRQDQRLAIITVAAYARVDDAVRLAEDHEAWSVMGKVLYLRGRFDELEDAMRRHKEVATETLKWLNRGCKMEPEGDGDLVGGWEGSARLRVQSRMQHLMHLGETSENAKAALEQVLRDDPDGVGKLAWVHSVADHDFNGAAACLLNEERQEQGLQFRHLLASLARLSQEAALRHHGVQVLGGTDEISQRYWAIREDQDLVNAQLNLLVPPLTSSLPLEETIERLIKRIAAKDVDSEMAICIARSALDLVTYHKRRNAGNQHGTYTVDIWREVLRRDWAEMWSPLAGKDISKSQVSDTVFVKVTKDYSAAAKADAVYESERCGPTRSVLESAMQKLAGFGGLNRASVLETLVRVRNSCPEGEQWED